MAIIFGLAAILCLAVHREYLYSVKQMIESVFFIGGINGGIGNVWIVRIYMLMAFMTPIFIIIDRIENDWKLISLFIALLSINEIIVKGLYVEGTFRGAFVENIISSVLCRLSYGDENCRRKEFILLEEGTNCLCAAFINCTDHLNK